MSLEIFMTRVRVFSMAAWICFVNDDVFVFILLNILEWYEGASPHML